MKVIKSGIPGGAWTKELVCTGKGNGSMGCGALLEVNGSDLFHTSHTDYAGDTDHYVTFECPECKEWTDVSENDTDYSLRRYITNKETCSRNRNISNDPL